MRNPNGRFAKGNLGKPKGANHKNKITANAMIQYFLEGGFAKFKANLDKLPPKQYLNFMIKIMAVPYKYLDDEAAELKATELLLKLNNNKNGQG